MSIVYVLTHTVQIHDTDCYGVVWHGSYSRWLETGRVGLCQQLGIAMEKPGQAIYLYPVVDQHLRFKASATVGDTVTLTTTLTVDGFRLVFHQQVMLDERLVMEADTTCVVVTAADWRVYRRLPADLAEKLAVG